MEAEETQQTKTKSIITLTKKAAKKIKSYLEKENKKNKGLRISLYAMGCCGPKTTLSFEEKPKEKDIELNQNGVRIFVEGASKELLKGSIVDYVKDETGEGFVIQNPQKKECACGETECS